MKHLWMVALVACGCDEASNLLGEPDMGPAEVVLAVDDDAVIADLDEMAQDEICQALFDAVDRQVPIATKCAIVGIAGAIDPGDPEAGPTVGQCETVQTACEPAARLGQQALPGLMFTDCGLFKGDTSMCQTTIGEFRACLNLMADTAVGSVRELVTCGLIDPNVDEVPEILLPSPEVPEGAEECARVRLGCPGVFEADDETPMMMSEE